jgi:hypothetical protein
MVPFLRLPRSPKTEATPLSTLACDTFPPCASLVAQAQSGRRLPHPAGAGRDNIRDGWRHSPKTDKPRKLQKCLLPWRKGDLAPYAGFAEQIGAEELPEEEKEKDRAAVREIATILTHAGYTIVEARSKGKRAQKV